MTSRALCGEKTLTSRTAVELVSQMAWIDCVMVLFAASPSSKQYIARVVRVVRLTKCMDWHE